jgi:hypothetical protein
VSAKLVLDLTFRFWSLCSCTLCAPANGRGLNPAPPCCDTQRGGTEAAGYLRYSAWLLRYKCEALGPTNGARMKTPPCLGARIPTPLN